MLPLSCSPSNPLYNSDNCTPVDGLALGTLGDPNLPAIIFGGATFSHYYNSDAFLETSTPLQTVKLALRYGIRAFDTAPLYGPSEIMLGDILKSLESEFPRSSYQLMTKCGRFGGDVASFDYSPASIRANIHASLDRLKTSYLDTVYLHDVEFVCREVSPWIGGNPARALAEETELFGLAEGQEGNIREEGEQRALGAIAELRRLQDEGLVRNVGISGYPLPSLLRIALLVLHTPPYKPLDIVLSYSHLSLQNRMFSVFAPQFRDRAKVRQLVTASPLNMALFTPEPPPPWHPAPPRLLEAVTLARKKTAELTGGIADLALGYAFRNAQVICGGVPVVVGLSTPQEVHECMKAWRDIRDSDDEERKVKEECIVDIISQSGFLDWSWPCPLEGN